MLSTFSSYEKVLVLYEKLLSDKTAFTKVSVYQSVCSNSSSSSISSNRKSKDKFVNHPRPTKIVKIKAFFVFLKFKKNIKICNIDI